MSESEPAVESIEPPVQAADRNEGAADLPSDSVAKAENASTQVTTKSEDTRGVPEVGNSNIGTSQDVKTEVAPATQTTQDVPVSEKAGSDLIENSDNLKRQREEDEGEGDEGAASNGLKLLKTDVEDDGDPIPASKEGTSFFNDADVLSGRGGGTNVHPGNRNFRDLINLHRRAYLKARKNDKPAISRAIVRSIRDSVGRFLRKDDKSGLWFEIGDDAAREKTSQALRQRAPEMRKLLFDTEREEARSAAEDHIRHQRMMMGMPPDAPPGIMPPGMQMPPMAFPNPAFFQAMAANGGKPPGANPNGQDPYQMFQAAIMNNNMNRFPASNGGS